MEDQTYSALKKNLKLSHDFVFKKYIKNFKKKNILKFLFCTSLKLYKIIQYIETNLFT